MGRPSYGEASFKHKVLTAGPYTTQLRLELPTYTTRTLPLGAQQFRCDLGHDSITSLTSTAAQHIRTSATARAREYGRTVCGARFSRCPTIGARGTRHSKHVIAGRSLFSGSDWLYCKRKLEGSTLFLGRLAPNSPNDLAPRGRSLIHTLI